MNSHTANTLWQLPQYELAPGMLGKEADRIPNHNTSLWQGCHIISSNYSQEEKQVPPHKAAEGKRQSHFPGKETAVHNN